jgi:hypothetical protein
MAEETVSEVLAQSNTKTPDFMAPVLAQDMGITRTREHSSMPQEARREVPDPITISELVEGADEAVGDFIPGWGDYKTYEDLRRSIPTALDSPEDLERSTLLASALLLGIVPGAGDYASKLLKRAAKKEPITSAAEPSLNLTQKETDFFDEFLDSPTDRYALQEEVPSLVVENGVLTVSPVDVDALEDWIMDGILADGALSVPPRLRKGDVFNRFAGEVSSFQEGGIASLPNNPVLAGQQHMLAYITPEEASTLREQGGGVTPTGGQYRGPGGIASFPFGGAAGPAAASAAASASAAAAGMAGVQGIQGGLGLGNVGGDAPSVGGGSGPSPYGDTNPDFGLSEGLFGLATADTAMGDILSQTQVLDDKSLAVAISKENAKKSIVAIQPVNELYALRNPLNPKSMAYADLTAQISDAKADAVAKGYSPGAISKANQIAHMNVPDIMGNVTLALALGDQQFTAFDIAHMSDADFSALSANPATSVVGDPKSPLGMAVLGLSKPLMTMLAPPLALPMQVLSTVYGLANPDEPSLGLFGLAEQGYKGLFGETMGETLGDVSREMGLGRDPVANVTGYVSNQLGLSDAVSQIGNVFGTSTPSTPNVPGGPGLPAMQSSNQPPAGIPSVEIGLPVPPTTVTETLEDATSSYYAAQQLADATGTTLAQAEDYLASRYPQQLT